MNATLLKKMRDMGLSLDQAIELAETWEAGSAKPVPELSKAALRTRKWREKNENKHHGDVTVTHHGDSHGDVSPSCARVRDKTPKLVITNSASASSSAGEPDFEEPDLDWPESWPPSRSYLDQIEAVLRDAAAPAVNAAAPKLKIVSAILALGRSGKGPRCELQLDVLPAIRACAAKTRPGSVSGWEFFRPAILEARDRRLAQTPEVADVARVVPFRGIGPPRTIDEKSSASWDYAIAKIAQDDQSSN